MRYALTTTAEPAAEPVTAEEAAGHCRAAADDAAELATLVRAARLATEKATGRRWVTQTVRLTLGGWPPGGHVALPVQPVRSVSSVKYRDAAGTLTTVDPADWQGLLDHNPPLVAPAPGGYWPPPQAGALDAVQLELVAGYGDPDAVPADAKAAVLLAVAYWFENRGDGRDPAADGLPPAAVRLLGLLDDGGYG